MRLYFKTKNEAFAWAQERAQRLGNDHLVVQKRDGSFAAGSEHRVTFAFPELRAWRFCYKY